MLEMVAQQYHENTFLQEIIERQETQLDKLGDLIVGLQENSSTPANAEYNCPRCFEEAPVFPTHVCTCCNIDSPDTTP